MIFLTILFYGICTAYEAIPLYKEKQWRDFWVNIFTEICSFSVAVLITFRIPIPSPSEPIKNIVLSLFGGG